MTKKTHKCTAYLSEQDILKITGLKKISTARWIGEKGHRKIAIRGECEDY